MVAGVRVGRAQLFCKQSGPTHVDPFVLAVQSDWGNPG